MPGTGMHASHPWASRAGGPMGEAVRSYLENSIDVKGSLDLSELAPVGSTGRARFELEEIVVPFRLGIEGAGPSSGRTVTLDKLLSPDPPLRWIVSADPGGGKTTLLKLMALLCVDPARARRSGMSLPSLDMLPIVIHCRDLAETRLHTLTEHIELTARKAEMTEQEARSFAEEVCRRDDGGRGILLMCNGLDEIADARGRQRFVRQLGQFMASHPQMSAILTTRTFSLAQATGALKDFRHVEIAPLDSKGIEALCRRWALRRHGTDEGVDELVERIVGDGGLRRLASNPLMLTSILMAWEPGQIVRKKRAEVYADAIDMLLYRWNVLGYGDMHESYDMAKYPLAYVAFEMQQDGRRSVTNEGLVAMLRRAAREIDDVFGKDERSIQAFVRDIERCSGLIVKSRSRCEDGTIQEAYSFWHPTFQEYLAAWAVEERCHAGSQTGMDGNGIPIATLRGCLGDGAMRETVLMCASLQPRYPRMVAEWALDDLDRASDVDACRQLRALLLGLLEDDLPLTGELAERILSRCVDGQGDAMFERLCGGRHERVARRFLRQGGGTRDGGRP